MGQAIGELFGDVMIDFFENQLPQFFIDQLDQIDLSNLPQWVQTLVHKATAAEAPAVFNQLLKYVYDVQLKYQTKLSWDPTAEMEGMARGICARGGNPDCDEAHYAEMIKNLNMLPELIKMSCTIMGAYGDATPDGNLVQLRALDFGSGPFANYSVLVVYHPDEGNPFASVTFPGFAGLVTGLSSHVSLSEKVWETYDKPDLQPGTYKGETVSFVMREMVQFADTKEQAIQTARDADRTWSVFLGIGDNASQEMNIIGYREKDLQVFGPTNMTLVTNQTSIPNTVFVDRHPQPTHDPKMLPALIQAMVPGKITGESTVQLPRHAGPTGDVHIAIYDWGQRTLIVGIGETDANGDYFADKSGMACNRSFVSWKMDDLWDMSTFE
jgi:hypothetical protein